MADRIAHLLGQHDRRRAEGVSGEPTLGAQHPHQLVEEEGIPLRDPMEIVGERALGNDGSALLDEVRDLRGIEAAERHVRASSRELTREPGAAPRGRSGS